LTSYDASFCHRKKPVLTTITEKMTKITGFRNQVPKLSADDHGFRIIKQMEIFNR